MFKYNTFRLCLVKKNTNLLVVICFLFAINFAFSQQINQGELLNEKTFEITISENRKVVLICMQIYIVITLLN